MLEIRHKPFTYVFIPCDIANEVEERQFEGTEGEFQDMMKRHFSGEQLYGGQKEVLKKNLTEGSTTELPSEQVERAVELSYGTYQIIPLRMPSKLNHWQSTNFYIDNIGRVKELPTNARATRIASDNIRGDVFLSCAKDKEDEPFERVRCSMSYYHELLNNPPSVEGRWNQLQAMEALKKQLEGEKPLALPKTAPQPALPRCENCFGKESEGKTLSKCGRCRKVSYCSRACQKADWSFHKSRCSS